MKNAHPRKKTAAREEEIKELTQQKEDAEEDAEMARTTATVTVVTPSTQDDAGANTEARVGAVKELLKSLVSLL